MNKWIELSWILFIIFILIIILTDTIRRGFERIARQQKETNRIMIHLAQQMGYSVEDDGLKDAVRELIQHGDKIKAIKLVRSRKGEGLKEAKEYVDEIENSMK